MIATHIQTKPATFGHAHDTPPHYRIPSDWHKPTEPAFGQCVVPSRSQMEAPRPLEPRHERTPSSTTPTRRLDSFSGPTSARSPPQHQTQTLPGVRDILSPPGSNDNGYAGHENWRASPGQHHYPEQRYQAQVAPRPEHFSQQERRLELPILETRRGAGLPASPYGATYHESHPDGRPRQLSTSSYSTGSPYAMPYDEATPRSTNGYDRPLSTIFTPTNDSSRRYVGIKDFPEGQFHVYDDGYRLPTHVDGEQVNPQWGLTKANKPRKRLALACMDCREKKIKCEPGATSCLQCEKAKRTCRRYGAPKAASEAPSRPDTDRSATVDATSTAEWSSNAGSPPARAGAIDITPPGSKDANTEHINKRRAQDEPSHTMVIKKQKSASPPPMPNGIASVTTGQVAVASQPGMHSESIDPYEVNPARTMHLVDIYFQTINNGVYSLFPKEPFMRWVADCKTKSLTDRMVIHAMMAMASVFIPETRPFDWKLLGEHCAQLASNGLNTKFGIFSLQIVHVRLLLALYSFARNMRGVAWEHCGAAMRTISALRLNNEEGCDADKLEPDAKAEPQIDFAKSRAHARTEPLEDKTYGLRYNQIVECSRRAFWCGFMMDRFNGFCEGMLCTVDKADIYLRLPCSQSVFEKGARSQAPFFDNGIIERSSVVLTSTAPVSHMAHLALVTSIWGDVMNFVYRGVHRSSQGHAEAYELFYAETYKNLSAWSARLPMHLEYTESNLIRSIHEGYAGDFITLHVMYHYALIKLNRYMRWSLMQDKLPRNICEAHVHAHHLLSIISAFNKQKIEINATAGPHPSFTMSTPFVGFAIISTIDIISAGGSEANLKSAIAGMKEGLTFLRELAMYWASIADQHRAGEKRFLQLTSVISRPYKAQGGCWLGRQWGLQNPLENEVDPKDDCIYGVDDPNLYYSALEGLQVRPLQRGGP